MITITKQRPVRTIAQNGVDICKKFEGLYLHPYLDPVGIPTIGWGTVMYENGHHVTMHDPAITVDRANQLLMWEMNQKTTDLSAMVTSEINQNQVDALGDFAYNEGSGALKRSTLLSKVNANPNDPTIRDEFMKFVWGHKDGQLIKLSGLVSRRNLEATLYFNPTV